MTNWGYWENVTVMLSRAFNKSGFNHCDICTVASSAFLQTKHVCRSKMKYNYSFTNKICHDPIGHREVLEFHCSTACPRTSYLQPTTNLS